MSGSRQRWIEWLPLALVALFTIWGFVLRIYSLGYLSVWLDEAITILAAKSVHASGLPILPSGWFYTAGFFQSYVLAFVGLFSWSEFWMRLPSVVVGTALIPLSWYLARKVWNERVGVALAAFMAFNYWQIAWSRQARMYIFLELFFILGLYFVWRFVNDGKARDGLLAAVFTVLAMTSHLFGVLLVPIAAIAWFAKRRTLRLPGDWRYQVVYALLGALVAWYVVKTAFGLQHTIWYLPKYLDWLITEYYALIFLLPLALFLGWKERLLVVVLVLYTLGLSYLVAISAYRYFVWLVPIAAVLVILVLDRFVHWKYVFPVAIVLLLAGTHPLLVPQKELYLESGTPQPPYREVYANLPEDVYHVDAEPVVAVYYGRMPDGWLRNSLTGLDDAPREDGYLGLTHVQPNGYVVVSERALYVIDSDILNSSAFIQYGQSAGSNIRVYDFEVTALVS